VPQSSPIHRFETDSLAQPVSVSATGINACHVSSVTCLTTDLSLLFLVLFASLSMIVFILLSMLVGVTQEAQLPVSAVAVVGSRLKLFAPFLPCLRMYADDNNDQVLLSMVAGVTLKVAVDSTGGAADQSSDKSDRFTSSPSLDMVHRLRACSDAVLVGKSTVMIDDCTLTVRRNITLPAFRPQPIRVVLDPNLSLVNDRSYSILTDGIAKTVIYHAVPNHKAPSLKLADHVQLVYLPPSPNTNRINVSMIVQDLQQRFGVKHLMVEGGPITAQEFLKAGLIDRAIIVHADKVTFKRPYPSGLTASYLRNVGNLVRRGSYTSGEDTVECWSRPDLSWPTESLQSFP
jgi:riboflavin-specific deaminase-like protein